MDITEIAPFFKPGRYPIYLQSCCRCTETELQQFSQDFHPQSLLPGKTYWLHLEADGSFTVRWGENGNEIPCLSETENWVYQYLCFFYCFHFWKGQQGLKKEHRDHLYALVADLSNRLDESVDIHVLMDRARSMNTPTRKNVKQHAKTPP